MGLGHPPFQHGNWSSLLLFCINFDNFENGVVLEASHLGLEVFLPGNVDRPAYLVTDQWSVARPLLLFGQRYQLLNWWIQMLF